MKKHTPFLNLYHSICNNGRLINGNGLCYEEIKYDGYSSLLIYDEIFDMLSPSNKEINENGLSAYWAYDDDLSPYLGSVSAQKEEKSRVETEFTSLRQTVLLLCAAVNGEL